MTYNQFGRLTYLYDQDVFSYIQVENTQKFNFEFLTFNFFRFLDSNLLSNLMYKKKYNLKKYHLDFTELDEHKLPYIAYAYKDPSQSFLIDEPTYLLSDINFDLDPTFYRDLSLYQLNTSYPFDGLQNLMLNFTNYSALPESKFITLNYFMYLFFFDYFIYSLKILLLDNILYYEYNYILSTNFIFGPITVYLHINKKKSIFEKLSFIFNKLVNFFYDFSNFEKYTIKIFDIIFYYGFLF